VVGTSADSGEGEGALDAPSLTPLDVHAALDAPTADHVAIGDHTIKQFVTTQT